MIDIIFRYDPANMPPLRQPATPAEAQHQLEEGNREFAHLLDPIVGVGQPQPRIIPFDPQDMGLAEIAGTAPHQQPFAVVLGCSDARVPIEVIFNQGCNDLFVIRVAGNVLGNECLGSIDYALDHLGDSIKLLVVLGHGGCGAVTAAVDAFLDPSRYLSVASSHPLRAIVDRLFVAVRAAAQSLEEVWGHEAAHSADYRKVLIETAIALNAALTAATLQQEFRGITGEKLQVVYGVYDLVSRRVRSPGLVVDGAGDWDVDRLVHPPADLAGFKQLGVRLAGSDSVKRLFALH